MIRPIRTANRWATEEVKLTKKFYGWPEDAQFLVPDGVYDRFKNGIGKRGGENHAAWTKVYNEYKAKFPELDQQLQTMQKRRAARRAGTRICRTSLPTPKAWRRAIPRARF